MLLADRHVPGMLAAFDLGTRGRLSHGPVASGRLGSIWRLDTDPGSWAVKHVEDATDSEIVEITDGAAFQEAAHAAGVSTPAVRRTGAGEVIATVADTRVRLHEWVDLRPPALDLDPAELGRLVAGLHLVEFTGTVGTNRWFEEPVGEDRWRGIIRELRARGAPFSDELEALVPPLVALEAFLGGSPRSLRTCHRDLWADNIRRTASGALCVFDFDNAGLADPSQELALVIVEFSGDDGARGRAIQDAYTEAGGPGRVDGPRDFAMVIAQLAHIVEEGCRRWLAATTDDARAENEGWIREFLDRPLTPAVVERLLAD
jgi:aminoglycoside phosphotransferase (APT) family kinase protein